MNNMRQGERGIDILHGAAELAAIHDSAEGFPQPKCHPETRTKMLTDLREWALDPHPQTTILWLYGPAGAGKSAIMQTLAGQLREARRLGGSFFFKRSHATRGNARILFATIAYQLALSVSWLRTAICTIVEDDPSIIGRSIATQMETLISQPSRSHGKRGPITIIIDGLDECAEHDVQQEILRVICNTSSDHTTPFRFLVASRPEPHIREVFESSFYACHCRSFNVEQSFADVRKYLCDEFARIHREHYTMARIPLPWPSHDILEKLVGKSSGHFIYASTIIKFIDDKNYRPTVRLEMVQNTNSPGSESAYDALDQLYMTVLSSAPRQSELTPILCAIVNFMLCPEEIDQLFRLAEGETRLLLRSLHSVLNIPRKNDDAISPSENGKISSHHASFLDFLNNVRRSRTFCVSTLQHRIDLARIVLKAYAGPHEPGDIFLSQADISHQFVRFLHNWIRFLVSLPPSAEVAVLLALIGAIDREYIFASPHNEVPGRMLAWLKKILSAPRDLIKLWEDYECMVSFQGTVLRWSPSKHSGKHIFLCSPEFLRLLISLVMFRNGGLDRLPSLRGRLDVTFTEIRATICSPRSNIDRDQHAPPVLAVRLAFRDVALQCIRKMVKNQIDIDRQAYSSEPRYTASESIRRMERNQIGVKAIVNHIFEQRELVDAISYLVRLSPPCPMLYWELWSISLDSTWYHPWHGFLLIHHVSKWLECFPIAVPAMELIAFWKKADVDLASPFEIYSLEPQNAERALRPFVNRWNQTIVRLHLPDDLKLPLEEFHSDMM
ncbi:hypothetical protein C8R45DRAFT_1081730 [Mycena sanguinolenta]|nr:hypothetical protein C8R45DRAFT_1081730 [Mycena sanguinolenta]